MNSLFQAAIGYLNGSSNELSKEKDTYFPEVLRHINLVINKIGSNDDIIKGEIAIEILQAAMIATYDVHNALYGDKSKIFISGDNYQPNELVTKLYAELTDEKSEYNVGHKLKRICTQRDFDFAKKTISYVAEVPMTKRATEFIKEMEKECDKLQSEHFIVMSNIRSGISNTIEMFKKSLDTFKGTNIPEDDLVSSIVLLVKKMDRHFKLSIITKKDIEYFLSELKKIMCGLKDIIAHCCDCKKTLVKVGTLGKDSLSVIDKEIKKMNEIRMHIKLLMDTMENIIQEKSMLTGKNNGKNKVLLNCMESSFDNLNFNDEYNLSLKNSLKGPSTNHKLSNVGSPKNSLKDYLISNHKLSSLSTNVNTNRSDSNNNSNKESNNNDDIVDI